ncbi:DUF1152 domain-containing protein [Nocardia thailandica]
MREGDSTMDWTPALLTRLLRCRTVLLAGAGGGFDVYGGLPLGVFLAARGVRVHYANLSFVDHAVLAACADEAGIGVVGADTAGPAGYFPERSLARWLGRRGWEPVVHAFPSTGAAPLRERYRHLVERLGVDAVVLVDGGTDILLRGDEELLGTPEEDAASLAAVAGVDTLAERFVVSIGFGVDAHHGVSHVHVLENIAELDAEGAFLGAFSIPGRSAEADAYREAVRDAARETPRRSSIVNGQIAAALSGAAGDVALPGRARATGLFVNPLMALYFTFELDGLARNNRYLPALADTRSIADVARRIGEYRVGVELRAPRPFPH